MLASHLSPRPGPSPPQGDALDPQQPWRELLKGAAGVVSTMGAFGSNDYMYKVGCGCGCACATREVPISCLCPALPLSQPTNVLH